MATTCIVHGVYELSKNPSGFSTRLFFFVIFIPTPRNHTQTRCVQLDALGSSDQVISALVF